MEPVFFFFQRRRGCPGTAFTVVLFACATLQPIAARAQSDPPNADVAVSYAFIHPVVEGSNYPTGWVASASWYRTPAPIAVVVEAGGSYHKDQVPGLLSLNASIYTFMGGVRVVQRRGPVIPFAQGLVGVKRFGNNLAGSSSLFALQPGAGVDVKIAGALGVRLQADYQVVTAGGNWGLGEWRLATGVFFSR